MTKTIPLIPGGATLIYRPSRPDNSLDNGKRAWIPKHLVATLTRHPSRSAALAGAPEHLTWEPREETGYLVAADRSTGGTWILVDHPAKPASTATTGRTVKPYPTLSRETVLRLMCSPSTPPEGRIRRTAPQPETPKTTLTPKPLTDRTMVASLLAEGLTAAQIASTLNVNQHAVHRAIRILRAEQTLPADLQQTRAEPIPSRDVIDLHEQGRTPDQIADHFSVDTIRITRMLTRLRQRGAIQ